MLVSGDCMNGTLARSFRRPTMTSRHVSALQSAAAAAAAAVG